LIKSNFFSNSIYDYSNDFINEFLYDYLSDDDYDYYLIVPLLSDDDDYY